MATPTQSRAESDDPPSTSTSTFQTLPPPHPPTDLIASALFIPLASINTSHRGRKLRLTAQIIHYDPHSSLLLLAAYPHKPHTPTPTLLVDTQIALLGRSPALKNVHPEDNAGSVSGIAQASGQRDVVGVARETLRLDVGEWITVVGWLEGDVRRYSKELQDWSVVDFGRYAAPFPVGLEAILITQSRPPPLDAIYRGELPGSMARGEM